MKKSLLAIAALSTIAGAAQAQSSVTLFGAIDAGGYYANQVVAKTAAAPSNSGAFGVLGNTIVSSNWGLKGTEDLGGGLKANFYAESGINPRNGTLSQAGGEAGAPMTSPTVTLFDRGLYVGIQGNSWGRVDIGNKLNPFYAAAAGLVPVAGNSVTTNAAQAGGYFLPFVHNSVSYQLPTMAGFNAAVQYGAGNAVNDSSAGSVTTGSLSYATGGLTLTAAGQYLASKGTPVSANNIGATYTIGATAASAAATGAAGESYVSNQALSPSIGTYLIGAKYNAGAFTIGAGFVANQVSAYTAPLATGIAGGAGTKASGASNRAYSLNQYQIGVGYQATPAVLLGLTWIGATSGSNLINAQARYAFSKRTQAYAQLGYAINTAGLGLYNNAGNMTALAGSGGGSFGGSASAVAAPNFNQAAFGVGMIHTF